MLGSLFPVFLSSTQYAASLRIHGILNTQSTLVIYDQPSLWTIVPDGFLWIILQIPGSGWIYITL